MATQFHTPYTTGKTVAVTLQQFNKATGQATDNWWKETGSGSGAWVAGASATAAERRIALTDSNSYGSYSGGKTVALGTYTGWVKVYYWDVSITTAPLSTDLIYLLAGNQQDPPEQISTIVASGFSPVSVYIVNADRTWVVERDAPVCRNVVWLAAGSLVTLAMDFSRIINPGAGLNSVTSVTDTTTGSAITIASSAVSQDRMKAHFQITGGLVAGDTHSIKVIVTTTDGDTLIGVGTVKVR